MRQREVKKRSSQSEMTNLSAIRLQLDEVRRKVSRRSIVRSSVSLLSCRESNDGVQPVLEGSQ